MRTFAAMLVLSCLALAACPDRGAAQHGPHFPNTGPVLNSPAHGGIPIARHGPFQQSPPNFTGQVVNFSQEVGAPYPQPGMVQPGPQNFMGSAPSFPSRVGPSHSQPGPYQPAAHFQGGHVSNLPTPAGFAPGWNGPSPQGGQAFPHPRSGPNNGSLQLTPAPVGSYQHANYEQGPYQLGPHQFDPHQQGLRLSPHDVGCFCPEPEQLDHKRRTPRFWGSAETLLTFRKSRQVPVPLVTTSPSGPPPTNQTEAGVLGFPTTSVLFGDEGLRDNPQHGLRGEIGVWLDHDARLGVGASFTDLQEDSVTFSASSDGSVGSTILARPFFNTLSNQQASQLVAYPEIVSGSIDIRSGVDIYGFEGFGRYQLGPYPITPNIFYLANGIMSKVKWVAHLPGLKRIPGLPTVGGAAYNLFSTPPMTKLDLIAGYQHNRVEDELSITNNLVSLDNSFLGQIGTTLDAFDRFETKNEFYGATLGLKSVSQYGRWSVTMLGKVGLGHMHQNVTINGQTVITVPGGPTSVTNSGLFAQQSNIGSFNRDRFAVLPEAQIMLNYNILRCLKFGIGYDFMYWNDLALAGLQINPNVDLTQTNPDPSFAFFDSDFFVHAAKLQVQLNY